MYILYQLIYIIGLICYYSCQVCRGKFHRGNFVRLGIFDERLRPGPKEGKVIWIHAVSVGEATAARPLIDRILKENPDQSIFFTTVTPTGNALVRSWQLEKVAVGYLPVDLTFVIEKFLRVIQPKALILLETEIWPNLIRRAKLRNVPVCIVNGRLSPKSFALYRKFLFFFKKIVRQIDCLCVQDSGSAERFKALGAGAGKIRQTGNLKFDSVREPAQWPDQKRAAESGRVRDSLLIGPKERLIVCGSTHPGEEEILVSVFKRLKAENIDLKMIIVPRYIARADSIAEMIRKCKETCSIVESLKFAAPGDAAQIVVLRAMGLLQRLYLASDIAFIGGSLVNHGGQNPLEAAVYAKTPVFGKHMHNFQTIADQLLAREAACAVAGADDLYDCIKELLALPEKRKKMGERALKMLKDNMQATEKTFSEIKAYTA